jgi:hypothetical protein
LLYARDTTYNNSSEKGDTTTNRKTFILKWWHYIY